MLPPGMQHGQLAARQQQRELDGAVDSALVVELHTALRDYPAGVELPSRAGQPFCARRLAPIEWDLALCTPEDVESYIREARRRGVHTVDPEILQVMNAARMLQMVASCALIPQLPLLAEGLKPSLEAWRGMPFAGGLG